MRRRRNLAAGKKVGLVAHRAHGLKKRDRIEVEDGDCPGLIAGLHAVAGQAKDVGDAHGRGAEHVALDSDAISVAASRLHDDRVAHARQQRADADRGHVAVGARSVDSVDGVDPALKDGGSVVDILRVGGVGRVQLRRHCELAAPKHALEPPARRVAGQRIERQVDAGRVFVAIGHERLQPSPLEGEGAPFACERGGRGGGLRIAATTDRRTPPLPVLRQVGEPPARSRGEGEQIAKAAHVTNSSSSQPPVPSP